MLGRLSSNASASKPGPWWGWGRSGGPAGRTHSARRRRTRGAGCLWAVGGEEWDANPPPRPRGQRSLQTAQTRAEPAFPTSPHSLRTPPGRASPPTGSSPACDAKPTPKAVARSGPRGPSEPYSPPLTAAVAFRTAGTVAGSGADMLLPHIHQLH